MDEDKIDASVDLIFSLELFALHKLSGMLQAELHRAPGILKHSVAFLEIVNGIVVVCFFIDKKGQQHAIEKEALIQLDEEKGPFEWSFQPSKSARSDKRDHQFEQPEIRMPSADLLQSVDPNAVVPRSIAAIDWRWLHNWTTQQCQSLSMVWQLIDGRRTVGEIKDALVTSHPPALVDESLRVLRDLKVIAILK